LTYEIVDFVNYCSVRPKSNRATLPPPARPYRIDSEPDWPYAFLPIHPRREFSSMHAAMATLHSNRALPTNADVYRIDRRLADTADPPRSMPADWTFCD